MRVSQLESEQETNIKFLVILAKGGSKIKMSVQVYGDNVTKKTAVYKWVTRFSETREVSPMKRDQDG
jgi:hypothetical protein